MITILFMAIFLKLTLIILWGAFILWLFKVIALYKIFKKAGIEGWKSIIPIYNTYILFKVAGLDIIHFLLYYIPGINIVMSALLSVNLSEKFKKDMIFALGLLFFNTIFILILGFGDSKYYVGKKNEV